MRTNDESIKLLENSKPIKRQTETDTGRETDRWTAERQRGMHTERQTAGQFTDRHAGRH